VRSRRVIFVYFDGCEVLDFAGPLQAFHEANSFGAKYCIEHCATVPQATTNQGLQLGGLGPLADVATDDLVLVPGFTVKNVHLPQSLVRWLKRSYDQGAVLGSVCTGVFALAQAGLIQNRRCTTHWKRTAELQKLYPRAHVLADRLFVEDGRIITSAGIAAGIDMALALIERDHGPLMAAKVAREMVVYIRRDAHHQQQSVYLDYRTHLHPGVHLVQDWLTSHPAKKARIEELAKMVHMSARNLTRSFRQVTGVSIQNYRTRLRLEQAQTLMSNPELSLEAIAGECGFADPRQFRRVWRKAYHVAPSGARQRSYSD
jgi:transcriptional regulator GlxA family with amidase domain